MNSWRNKRFFIESKCYQESSERDLERVRRTDGEEEGSGAVEEDLYKTVARNCFRYFGFTSFKQVDQLTLAEYELMMEALELRMLDESLHEHRQAFLNLR